MKKKLMMVAVLLGALTLGACVDNDESASVTNVREAKAEQLKSIAAMNNAEAQAKLIYANAEAALKAAQADAEKANAEKTRAEIEIAKKQAELIELQKEAAKLQNEEAVIRNKQAQAKLEEQLAQLEVTKKNAEATLARIAAEMEQQEIQAKLALAKLQLELKKAEQKLLNYDQRIADAKTQAEKEKLEAEKEALQTLSRDYSEAINGLINEQQSLSGMKKYLVLLKEGLMTAEASKAEMIADNNNEIALNNSAIDAYKKYTNYTEDVNALCTQLGKIGIEMLPLYDKWNVALAKLNSLSVDGDALSKAADPIYADAFFKFMQSSGGYLETIDGKSERISTSPFNQYIEYSTGNSNELKYELTKYEYKVGGLTFSESFGGSYSIEYKFKGDPRELELDVNEALDRENSQSERFKNHLDDTQKQYNGKLVDPAGKPVLNAVEKTISLKKAYDAEKDPAKKSQLLIDYENALSYENSLASSISSYKKVVARSEKEIARINSQYAMYKDAANLIKALQVKIDARNKAVEALYAAHVVAWKEEVDARVAYSAKYSEGIAIETLLTGSDLVVGAEKIEQLIKDLEDKNAGFEKENADISSITNQKELIAYQEALIKAQEAIVAAKEIAVNDAKVALDAAMKNVH